MDVFLYFKIYKYIMGYDNDKCRGKVIFFFFYKQYLFIINWLIFVYIYLYKKGIINFNLLNFQNEMINDKDYNKYEFLQLFGVL